MKKITITIMAAVLAAILTAVAETPKPADISKSPDKPKAPTKEDMERLTKELEEFAESIAERFQEKRIDATERAAADALQAKVEISDEERAKELKRDTGKAMPRIDDAYMARFRIMTGMDDEVQRKVSEAQSKHMMFLSKKLENISREEAAKVLIMPISELIGLRETMIATGVGFNLSILKGAKAFDRFAEDCDEEMYKFVALAAYSRGFLHKLGYIDDTTLQALDKLWEAAKSEKPKSPDTAE